LIDSVSFLHSRGIVHRDIKLENLILTGEAIKLIDFGFALVSKPDESLKLLCGTPAYMPPEMLLKKEYRGPPIDIWTCGVVFYALLTGGLPFTAHTERDLHKKITSGIYHVPKEISPRA